MKADRQGAAPIRPGTQFGYSNSGFIVLGAIIEHVSRHRYDDWVARQVLRPAGMASTAIRTYKPADAPQMAHGYVMVGWDGEPLQPGARILNNPDRYVTTVICRRSRIHRVARSRPSVTLRVQRPEAQRRTDRRTSRRHARLRGAVGDLPVHGSGGRHSYQSGPGPQARDPASGGHPASRCVRSVCTTNKDGLPVLDRSRYAGVAVAVAEHRGAAAVVPLAMSRHRRET
jgi:CubicO group peptidase (beta-lactamase class C family)